MAQDHLVIEELRQLAVSYASGVDRRDRGRFLAAFNPDAALLVHGDGEGEPPTGELHGHEQLAEVVVRIARYPKTFHLLGQSSYDLASSRATGEVHCLARHLLPPGDEPGTLVMHVRYLDRYGRDGSGDWRIDERRVVVDWRETVPHRGVVPR